jgi:phosphatidylinositol alpha 1,6-mannosyltransferase
LKSYPRVAFLPDTFHEVNGVAHTSRHLEAFARRKQIPFLSVHAGPSNERIQDGNVTILQLARGPARFELDSNLDYDPFLLRHTKRVHAQLAAFKPDIIHLTGPGDMGTMGFSLSLLTGIPLVISWHTSLHEYAARRLERVTSFLGKDTSHAMGWMAEGFSLQILRFFYRQALMVMAPNQELIELTRKLIGKPIHLMKRGVDATLFSPKKRTRARGKFRVGYVGRLTAEKNVRFLAELGKALAETEIVIIGEGSEAEWLRQNVPNATLTGVLRGEELAEAYANLDLFAFPSTTDTFGNVVLEAMASGVPCVVTNSGGPKFLITEGITGHVARGAADFIGCSAKLAASPALHSPMRTASREYALKQSWDAVFEAMFEAYASTIQLPCAA